MRPTSRRASSRAFTLIELTVVVLVLALLSALVVPRLAAVQEGLDAKLSMDSVQRLASRARETAIATGRTVTMAFDSTQAAFELRQTNSEQEGQVLASAALHEAIEATRFRAAENDVTGTDWTVAFFADGTSEGGAIEVEEGGLVRTFQIGSKSGLARWQDGAMPASEVEQWPAGEMEQRG